MEELDVNSSTHAALSLRDQNQHRVTEYLSLYELLTPLVRRWRSLLAVPLLTAVVFGLATLPMRPRYQAVTTFTAETTPGPTLAGSLSGLVGQLGVPINLSDNTISPNLFAAILASRELASAMLVSTVHDSGVRSGPQPRTLLDVLAVTGSSEASRLEKGVKLLHKRMVVQVDKASGLISLKVEMPSPALAAEVANGMVTELNTFNLQRKQSQSREQRRFIESRLQSSKQELAQAEAALQSFLETNREYAHSPLLLFKERRLEREVQLRQELALALAKSYDEARIAEVRDTPVLTIVDAAVAPTRTSWPRIWLFVALGALLGGTIALLAAYLEAWRPAEGSRAGREYARLRRELRLMGSQMKDLMRLRSGPRQH